MKTHVLPCIAIFVVAASLLTSLRAAPPGQTAEPDPGYIAHEWGTFTSVQGADGVQMTWNPLVAPELPDFVYDRSRARVAAKPSFKLSINVAGKTGTAATCTQRLETPVIYFYSDRPRTLDIGVNFPSGTFTEWYPFAQSERPSLMQGPGFDFKADLHWHGVTLLSGDAAKRAVLPSGRPGSRYYAARDTDSNLLQTPSAKGTETEKFLFYRGVGGFQAPLNVRLAKKNSRRLILTNNGAETLANLFVYEVSPGGAVWSKADPLQPGETRATDLPENTPEASLETLSQALREALVGEGLYEPEAAAMIKTWESAWFAEKGLRVLYTLPRQWTERILPLRISPAPNSTERVMIGRAEIITPEMELALLEITQRYIAASPQDRPAIASTASALGIGRFMEPTLRRIITSAKRTPQFSALSWDLLQAVINLNKSQPPTTAQN